MFSTRSAISRKHLNTKPYIWLLFSTIFFCKVKADYMVYNDKNIFALKLYFRVKKFTKIICIFK